MPQVIALALLGAGLYAGYRWVTRATREIADQMQRTDEELRQEANAAASRRTWARWSTIPSPASTAPCAATELRLG